MTRLTTGTKGSYTAADPKEAIERLAAYENLHEAVLREQESIAVQMAALRAAGKEKTVKYRELFTKKLQNVYVLSLFQSL